MPRGIVRTLAVAAALLFATTATAGELCVNYVSGTHIQELQSAPWWQCDNGECAFTSFNPRSRASVVVAKIASVPYEVTWDKDFGALSYTANGGTFRLKWKIGALPIKLSKKPHSTPSPHKPQQLGTIWAAGVPDTLFDTPTHRKIDVGYVEGCNEEHFGTPVIWTNTETGETKPLYEEADGDYLNGTTQLQMSTADNFILISTEYDGTDSIVADLNTGEIVLRTGAHSSAAGWGKCPAK
jgi:hypothetical protein